MTRRIAVIGASGFLGTEVVNQIIDRGDDEVIPIIRSSGSAWDLIRRRLPVRQVDILDRVEIRQALARATHVVNCARGNKDVMHAGLRNSLEAAGSAGCRKFVHISSVAVYGDPPPANSHTEDAPTHPTKGSYGWTKLRQDRMVERAARSGLPSVILCPPNISGPRSPFLLSLTRALQRGQMVQLEDGSAPCCIVDVRNLASACIASLESEVVDASRFFVSDPTETSWAQVLGKIALLAPDAPALSTISVADLVAARKRAEPTRASIKRTIRHLASSDVRQALARDPALRQIQVSLRRQVERMNDDWKRRLRSIVSPPQRQAHGGAQHRRFDVHLCAQQLRGVWHSNDRARLRLDYRPAHEFESSLEDFVDWYTDTMGLNSEFWDLLKVIHDSSR